MAIGRRFWVGLACVALVAPGCTDSDAESPPDAGSDGTQLEPDAGPEGGLELSDEALFADLCRATTGPSQGEGSDVTSYRLQDAEGNMWRLDGRADSASAPLSSVPGHNAFWFAWSAFNPGTPLWGVEGGVRDAEIPSGDQCLVPCDEIQPGCGGGLDCIPPLDDPKMVSPGSDELGYLGDMDVVIGVMTPEGPRAYPHNVLWWHEIANDTAGSLDYAVTLCPLTGSGLVFDRSQFLEGQTVRLGVSGNLYNSNLVMWDSENMTDPKQDDEFSLWPQMRMQAVTGPTRGEQVPLRSGFEMTWDAWRSLHPDTLVVSGATGFPRDYTQYPYDDFCTDDADTFRPTNPAPDPRFGNKEPVFGVFAGGAVKGYVWRAIMSRTESRRGVIEDEVGGVPVAIVYDFDSYYVHAFDRRIGGRMRDLELVQAP